MLPSLWKKEEGFPLLGFGRGIDRLFEDFFQERFPMAFWENGKNHLPALDVRETDEALIVEAELPGLKASEFEVKVEGGVLYIGAERKQEKDEKTKNVHRTERYYGRMERRLALPSNLEAEKVDATYKDGILTVTIPKKPESKPKSINVKVK
ncbi:MAG TPA: Hsp20/alpha crystallin family protein [Planctomycetota bacterium]|nr:Hsp20/alpha crystallin family protein [Planctomycetota bacterium]